MIILIAHQVAIVDIAMSTVIVQLVIFVLMEHVPHKLKNVLTMIGVIIMVLMAKNVLMEFVIAAFLHKLVDKGIPLYLISIYTSVNKLILFVKNARLTQFLQFHPL